MYRILSINFILETEPDEIRGHFLALRLGTTIYNKLAKEKEIPTQYIHSDKPLIENEKYTNSESVNGQIKNRKVRGRNPNVKSNYFPSEKNENKKRYFTV